MKKLKLCRECEITSECVTICRDAADFEKLDTESNYTHEKYKAKGVTLSWTDMRGTAGFGRFR